MKLLSLKIKGKNPHTKKNLKPSLSSLQRRFFILQKVLNHRHDQAPLFRVSKLAYVKRFPNQISKICSCKAKTLSL